ncbi:alpha-hydroxy acid oxidase [Hydrogenophaga sp. 2FB]|uniref:alpha-hydroxy acid oxidase n=1 Tax=Hydrogenophaga sp. 2FB TaxID=2502187 RepID=UPI0010F8F085|nr:alpha-hydroxy acid oxidase [Hydrogenophaga sp. 2FB]
MQPLDAALRFKPSLRRLLSLNDFDAAARRHLPHPLYAYVSGGVEDNLSREENLNAFQTLEFAPRVLRDVSRRTMATNLLGTCYQAPFGIGPMGISALVAYDGDNVMARAATAAGVPMVLSGASLTPLEEVAASSEGQAWFQAYLPGDEAQIRSMSARVHNAGLGTLVLTVDTAARANRENNIRAGFSTPLRPSLRLAWEGLTHPSWLTGTLGKTLLQRGMPHFENAGSGRGVPIISNEAVRQFNRDSLDWNHVAVMRECWRGRLVLKGVLHPEDAATAAKLGVDAIVVSNHGGRQLDGAVAPLKVLSSIRAATGSLPLIYDGGIRRGSDVLKALALGADFVLVARPFLYAAAVAGHAGVTHAISLLKEEVKRNMASLGLTSPGDAGPHILHNADFRPPSPLHRSC